MGIEENEKINKLEKEEVHQEEEKENKVLSKVEWERRRKKRVESEWKEYWKTKNKARAYFGKGLGEKRYREKRKKSIFLYWMRSGHERMSGTRYRSGEGKCKCGEIEDRESNLYKASGAPKNPGLQ